MQLKVQNRFAFWKNQKDYHRIVVCYFESILPNKVLVMVRVYLR